MMKAYNTDGKTAADAFIATAPIGQDCPVPDL
jgi:hypothetical protein